MEFKDTGLPRDRALEEAFKRGYAAMMETLPFALEAFVEEAEGMAAQRMAMLENLEGKIPEEKYDNYMQQIESQREMMLKAGPVIVRKRLDQAFLENHVHAAHEIALHASKPDTDAAAAILLIPAARSPLDIRRMGEVFGKKVEDLVVEAIHLEVYAEVDAEKTVASVSPAARSLELARMIGELNHQVCELGRVLKQQPNAAISIPDGVIEESFNKFSPYWGNDPKLDARFVGIFNGLAEKASSPFRLGTDSNGNLVLEQSVRLADDLAPPKKGKGQQPKGPGDLI